MNKYCDWFFALVVTLAALGCSRMDVVEREYVDASALRADGVISKGWVSEGLPSKAGQIKLAVNIDTNEAWAKFTATPDDITAISRTCPRVAIQATDLPRKSVGSWWPDGLTESGFKQGQAIYFRCNDGGMFAAAADQASAYFWRRSQ